MNKLVARKYLGEASVRIENTPFKDCSRSDWALNYINRYGGIDGEHHKTWVLDQVARILSGAPISVRIARWSDGTSEFRFTVGSSEAYEEFVKEHRDGEDGPETYDWDVGIAP